MCEKTELTRAIEIIGESLLTNKNPTLLTAPHSQLHSSLCLMCCFDHGNQRGHSCKFYFDEESYDCIHLCLNIQQIKKTKKQQTLNPSGFITQHEHKEPDSGSLIFFFYCLIIYIIQFH